MALRSSDTSLVARSVNIFAFDPCARMSALWLDDVRKNKMILESCQLLSTAMNVLAPDHKLDTYKTSYLNHPCAVWARESELNFTWLVGYTKHLLSMRGAPHKSSRIVVLADKFLWDRQYRLSFPSFEQTPFVNCAANQSVGVSFKHIHNTCAAYRMYIRARWSLDTIKLTWRHGEQPWWR